jgi:hypothetical protein
MKSNSQKGEPMTKKKVWQHSVMVNVKGKMKCLVPGVGVCDTKPAGPDDQTPESLCKEIIARFSWTDGETVLEPCCGRGNFFRNLPNYVVKDWCEIEEGKDFFDYEGEVDTVITNPPFRSDHRENLVIPFLQHALKVARKRSIFFVNHKTFNAFTPARLERYSKKGWMLSALGIYTVKKWSGRYYLLVFESTVLGKPITFWWDTKSYE